MSRKKSNVVAPCPKGRWFVIDEVCASCDSICNVYVNKWNNDPQSMLAYLREYVKNKPKYKLEVIAVAVEKKSKKKPAERFFQINKDRKWFDVNKKDLDNAEEGSSYFQVGRIWRFIVTLKLEKLEEGDFAKTLDEGAEISYNVPGLVGEYGIIDGTNIEPFDRKNIENIPLEDLIGYQIIEIKKKASLVISKVAGKLNKRFRKKK